LKVDVKKLNKISEIREEVLVLGVFQGQASRDKVVNQVDDLTGGVVVRFLAKNKKFGKIFDTVTFHISPKDHKKLERVVLVGLGKPEKLDVYVLRQIAGFIGKNAVKETTSMALYLPQQAKIADNADMVVTGVATGMFDPGHHKSKNEESKEKVKVESITFLTEEIVKSDQMQKGLLMADAINKAREVVNKPANIITPEYMVNFAKKMAAEGKLKIEIFSEKQVNEMGMGIMASVARGSEEDLYFVVMRYLGAGSQGPTLAIVGKGITFDSGGISIKPSESMEWMKMDMAGAAACFGAMEVIAKLKFKINVICACPLTENLLSGKATKPGDVVTGLSGKTVEVINTDAEGRLVLSDALTYVQKNFKPDYIVDLATLTGASVVALGNVATAALGRPQKFVDAVIQAGEQTGERMWQLPLYDEYRDLLKSYIADIANISPGRGAGTETGAKFLEEFVDKKQKWVHLDIAPTAWEEGDKPYISKGATGYGITTLVDLAFNLSKKGGL